MDVVAVSLSIVVHVAIVKVHVVGIGAIGGHGRTRPVIVRHETAKVIPPDSIMITSYPSLAPEAGSQGWTRSGRWHSFFPASPSADGEFRECSFF